MPRRRLGVVLLVPDPWAAEVDGLRRACGDGQLERVPPHVTLVPPVNVRVDDVPTGLAVLRAAAAATGGPLALRLGPPAGFHPASDTLYLEVGGDLDGLGRLRDAVFVPPFERPLDFPFVPHVTLADAISTERAAAAMGALSDYVIDLSIDGLHLLEEQRARGGRRVWVPIADARFETPAVVGRGGIELELVRSSLVDPEAAAFEATELAPAGARPVVASSPVAATTIVLTARRRGRLVGVARGWSREGERSLQSLLVAADERGQGIGRQLRLAFASVRVPDDGAAGPAG